MIKVLALDPATVSIGLAVFVRKSPTSPVRLRRCETIRLNRSLSIPTRLGMFRELFSEVVKTESPDVVILEQVR